MRFKFARVCVVSYLIKGIYAIKCNKKNVGFVEAKKYIKLTKEPNLHGQTLEQWKTNYTYSLLMLK